ncbi:MAG: hypothetical protein ACJ75H_03010 [Thermoanaerobaculia bacterium]
MDAPKPLLLAAVLAASVLGAAGCRGTPQPVTKADPAPTQTPPQDAAAAPTPATAAPVAPVAPQPPAARPEKPVRDGDPVVVDPGIPDGTPQTLVEAARAEKVRRSSAGEPVAVINDKTLPKYAAKGQITIADVRKKKGSEAAAAPAGAPAAAEGRGEQYWRSRGLEIRERWRQATVDVKELEQKTTELRQKFYMENDIYVRDNQVRPEWDRALDRLRQAKQEVETSKQELAAFLEEGREEGVMPGWLREGEDKEPFEENARKPAPSAKDPLPEHQSIEPPILNTSDVPPPGGLR